MTTFYIVYGILALLLLAIIFFKGRLEIRWKISWEIKNKNNKNDDDDETEEPGESNNK